MINNLEDKNMKLEKIKIELNNQIEMKNKTINNLENDKYNLKNDIIVKESEIKSIQKYLNENENELTSCKKEKLHVTSNDEAQNS